MARKRTQPDPSKPSKGRAVSLPPWWLNEVRIRAGKKADGKGDTSDQEIANTLHTKTGRRWDRTRVGDFLRDTSPTIEMAEAFCIAYDMPRFEWVARSYAEAEAFRRTAGDYDPVAPGDPSARVTYDSALEQLEKADEPQTPVVNSIDEVGKGRGRRPRRMGRGGT